MLRSLVYRHRLLGKQALAALIRFAPTPISVRLRSLADQIAFRLVPEYQGDTLPPIFHVWSNKFLKPQLVNLGIDSPESFYFSRILDAASARGRPVQVASLGAGGCTMEIELAKKLRACNIAAHIECVDFNFSLMSLARAKAREAALDDMLSFTVRDVNTDCGSAGKDIVIVNQFFHHIENLEFACEDICRTLDDAGLLLTCDIVGRNGHVLWPSVATVVNRHWQDLDAAKRFDRHSSRCLQDYQSIDHSAYSNEGVRAQDVVRVLLEHFDFDFFFTYGAAIMPFVERRIGFNFDPADLNDVRFISSVADEDERRVVQAEYPASNMIASLRKRGFDGSTSFAPVSPQEHAALTRQQEAKVGSRNILVRSAT